MKRSNISRTISTFMMVVTLVCCFGTTTVLAAEPLDSILVANNVVEPRAGTETLPLGWHTISSKFTITGHNTTPVKTVQGRYLQLNYNISKNATSAPVAVRIKIKDYYTGTFIGNEDIFFISENPTSAKWGTINFDLGYAGRKVQIYTRIENTLTYNEISTPITFSNYQSYVYN